MAAEQQRVGLLSELVPEDLVMGYLHHTNNHVVVLAAVLDDVLQGGEVARVGLVEGASIV